MKHIKLFEQWVADNRHPFSFEKEIQTPLFEGGAYGHLNHPFDDIDLTMNDMMDMINSTVYGSFSPDNFVQEKTDGQQLSVSWKDGQLVAARNKSQLKNSGENALTIQGVADMFKGRGEIETAYNAAMNDMSKAIGALPDDVKEKYFENGKKFASIEVITPITQNTVPYGLNMLVFHGVVEYDETGNPLGDDKKAGIELGKLIKDINADVQKTFYVRGPQDMEIKPLPNSQKRGAYYKKQLGMIIKDNSLLMSSTVGEYAKNRAKILLQEEADKAGVEIPETSLGGLADRIADISKSYNKRQMKNDLSPEAYAWYDELEKKKGKALKRQIYAPLENLFIELGTEFMKNMSSFLSANPTKAADEMRKEIDGVISKIKKEGGPQEIEKLEHELSRIAAAGGLESIVPTEGITFLYKGKMYKFTGIFAPIHQIRSMLAYKR